MKIGVAGWRENNVKWRMSISAKISGGSVKHEELGLAAASVSQ